MNQEDTIISLLKEHNDLIIRLIAAKVDDKFYRDDIKQEVLLIVYLKYTTLKNKQSFKIWLIKIIKNVCNKYYKTKSKLDIPIEDFKLGMIIEKQHLRKTQPINISQYVNKLPLINKDVVVDFYFNNMKIEEISFKHNIPIGTVKRRLHDARKKIKERIEKDES